MLSHGLQCGALLRASDEPDLELAAAGLVHDIADIAFPGEHAAHDRLGARFVEPLLGPRVARLVGAHVVAKRYLVATEPAYRGALSGRSTATLVDQGGALDAAARRELERDPDFAAILQLRRADERAKDPEARVPGLESWRPLLQELIEAAN